MNRRLVEKYSLLAIAGVSLLILLLTRISPTPAVISACCSVGPAQGPTIPTTLPSAQPRPTPLLAAPTASTRSITSSIQIAPTPTLASESLIFANLTPDGPFDTLLERILYPDQHAQLAAEVRQAYDYVSAQFHVRSAARFKAAFAIDEQCGLHGLTRADEHIAQVFTCNDIPRSRAVAIMAHELAHQLEFEQYGEAHLAADQILVEGMATWAAGEYWLGEYPDFRSYARDLRSAGDRPPLATDIGIEDVANMNRLYPQWASFVEFLITRYSREKFDQLYLTGHVSAGSADYMGVYGKSLDLLEQEWQSWLDG
jgi:hypothetical protein